MTVVVHILNPHAGFRWTPQPLLLVFVSSSNGTSFCWLLLSTTLLLVSFSNCCNCFCRLLGLALANNIWLLHPHLKQDQLVICLPYLSAKPYFPTFSFFKFICSSRWPSSHIESSPQKGLPHSPVRSSLNRIQIQTHPQSQQRQLSCVERSQLKQGDVTNGDSSITILNVR